MTDFSTEALLAGQGIYHVIKGGDGSGAKVGHPFGGNQYVKDSHGSLIGDSAKVSHYVSSGRAVGMIGAKEHESLAGRERNMAARMQRLANKTTDAGKKSAFMNAKGAHLAASKAHLAAAAAHKIVSSERATNGLSSAKSEAKALHATAAAHEATAASFASHESAMKTPEAPSSGSNFMNEHFMNINVG